MSWSFRLRDSAIDGATIAECLSYFLRGQERSSDRGSDHLYGQRIYQLLQVVLPFAELAADDPLCPCFNGPQKKPESLDSHFFAFRTSTLGSFISGFWFRVDALPARGFGRICQEGFRVQDIADSRDRTFARRVP